MRILEPKDFKKTLLSTKKTRIKKRGSRKVLFLLLAIPLLLSFALIGNQAEKETNNQQANFGSPKVVVGSVNDAEVLEFKIPADFSGNELRILYDNLKLANTVNINTPPVITGNDIADGRIRQIAESRGYKIRVVSNVDLPVVDGHRLQAVLRQPWGDMESAMASVGLTMSIASGYRSVEDQRALFLSRLDARGVELNDIISGKANEQINDVLIGSSIPGYSKHHSGYAIDFICSGWVFDDFKNSECYKWLSNNNYENAKSYGFIPSYPKDADLQGPDPEAWEYVFVGKEVLKR